MRGNKIEKQQFKDIKLQDFISIVLFLNVEIIISLQRSGWT